MLTVMKAKQARVECIQKTFLHRKSFFPSDGKSNFVAPQKFF